MSGILHRHRNIGCEASDIMKIVVATCGIAVALLLSIFACSRTSADDYVTQIRPLAEQYNSARDVVDRTIRAVDSATTLREGKDAARRGVSDLERAGSEMNNAYRALGNRDVPKKFHEHQQATLSAWRAGTEATVTSKLYLEKFLTTGQIDDSLLVAANRLFAEEDRYQLEARRALQAAR